MNRTPALRSLYLVPDFATEWTKSTLDMKSLLHGLRPFSQAPTDSYPGGLTAQLWQVGNVIPTRFQCYFSNPFDGFRISKKNEK